MDTDDNPHRMIMLLVGGMVALGIVLLVLGLLLDSQEPASAPGPAEAPDPAAGRPAPGPDARSDQSDPPGQSARQPSRRLPSGLRAMRVDPETRRKMLAAILARIAERQASRAESLDEPEPTGRGRPLDHGLSMDYIRERIHEITPLMNECYEMARENDPDLAGKIAVRFTFVGDEDHGGLVKDSRVMEGSSLTDNVDMVECVRETMYALRMKPPEGGGMLIVNYPFTFGPQEPAGPRQ